MKTIKTQVLIIGGGAAGLNTALSLDTEDVFLIEANTSNSVLCPWNLMIKTKNELRRKILDTGNNMSDLDLLEVFLDKHKESVKDLKNIGVKLRKSNIGLVPEYNLPGLEVRKIFLKKIKDKKVKILKGKVKKFLVDEKQEIRGVQINLLNTKKNIKIFFNYLILAAGGLSGLFQHTTGSKDSNGDILSLCYEAGFKIRDLEFSMFHPFLLNDKRLPRVLISGDILTKMEYEDENGKSFLSEEIAKALRTNEHHYVFPKMTREFYSQSLKGKIFGRFVCSNIWFEKFKKENEFGFIFKNSKKDILKKIEIQPAFHFSIGGLVINKNSQTNKKNVYAAGEITGGLYGSNRIGGLAILEALVFGKIAAMDINKKIKKQKRDIVISDKATKIGKLGLSDELKKKNWEILGPIKKKEELEKFKKFLENKKILTSQEKLIKKIIEICLLRENSIGSFYKENSKQVKISGSSFLINKKIIFKKYVK